MRSSSFYRHCSRGISTWGTPIDGAGSLYLKQRHLLGVPHDSNAPTAMPMSDAAEVRNNLHIDSCPQAIWQENRNMDSIKKHFQTEFACTSSPTTYIHLFAKMF